MRRMTESHLQFPLLHYSSVTSQKVKVQMDGSHLCSEECLLLHPEDFGNVRTVRFFSPLLLILVFYTRTDDRDQHKPCATTGAGL